MFNFGKNNKKNFDIHYNYDGKLLGDDIPFAVVESYKKLRTNLIFSFGGQKTPIFAVTSYQAKSGKTITSANIAISFAMIGKKVLLVDADMRLPAIHKAFKYRPQEKGLSTLLATADSDIDSYIMKTKYENLYIVDSGIVPPNPSELLSLKSVESFFQTASEKFDIIIVDMPPVGEVTDAALFAPYITGYIIVVRSEITRRADLEESVSFIEKNGGKIAGFVINGVNLKAHGYRHKYGKYGYGYDYGYGYSNAAERHEPANENKK